MKPSGLLFVIGFTLFCIFLSSCENDIKVVNDLNFKDTMPIETIKNMEMIYSDSGKIQYKVISPIVNRYKSNESYDEFPKGLTILVYDSLLQVKSSLRANYAIHFIKKEIVEGKNDVVIVSKLETINTEHIVWNHKIRSVYSDVFVKRTNKDGVLYGDGFDADETFSKYTIRNPRGTFTVQQ
jgi:LPS export ABC transporter protein LptC